MTLLLGSALGSVWVKGELLSAQFVIHIVGALVYILITYV